MGVETVSFIIAAFVDGSLGIAALMRNFRSRLCMTFAVLSGVLFFHDVVAMLETFASAGRLASPRLHIVLILATGPMGLWFLREVIPASQKRIDRWLWSLLPMLCVFLPFLALRIYPQVARVLFVASHLAVAFPAAVWMGSLARAQAATDLTRERLRLRYVFWGGVITLAFYVTDALHFAGFAVAPLGTLARVLYLMFVFQTFVQKELMTSEEVVAKLAHFGGVALMLSSIYSLLVSWVGDQPGLFFFNTLIASFVSIVLFDPIRNVTSRFTRKLFLRRNTALEDELNALSGDLMGVVEPTELARRIAQALKKTLGVEASALFLLERDGVSFVRVGEGDGRFRAELPASNPLVEYMTLRRGRPFVLETIENDRDSFHAVQPRKFCQSCLEHMRRLGCDFLIPFAYEARVVGFCALSTGERLVLSNEQLRLFIPVSRQIAQLIRNAQTFGILRDRDKLAAVGEMAAGLAHEIKNPLGAIKGAAQLLKEEIPGKGAAASEYLQIILDETNRLSGVLTDFLDYAKPRRSVPLQSCDPMRVIEHTASLILKEARVQLEVVSEKAGLTIDADPEVLKQVLLNLFLNAVQAMSGFTDTPTLRVTVREIRPRKPFPFADSLPLYKIWEGWEALKRPESRPFIEIEVADNGPGIVGGDPSRIFVPFYTTKPKGTGLGLAICQRLVESMGGTIYVKANRPTGAIFSLHLPVVRDEHKDVPLRDEHREVPSVAVEEAGAMA